MARYLLIIFFAFLLNYQSQSQQKPNLLNKLSSPVLFKGSDEAAYRDPVVLYYDNMFYMFFTLVTIEDSGKVFSYTAMSTSKDLSKWSRVKILTPRNGNRNNEVIYIQYKMIFHRSKLYIN